MTAPASYAAIFTSFFKMGLFTIGSGYAMIPLIEREVVSRRQWLDSEEFLDCLAVAQSIPGAMAINTAVFSAHRIRGFFGALVALLGVALPSFIVMIIVASFFTGIKDDPNVIAVFTGVRPAVAALIASSVISLSLKAKLNWWKIILGLAAALVVWLGGVSPAWVVVALVVAGLLMAKRMPLADSEEDQNRG
jgi:Chromate transport protein ChrA